MLTTRLGCDRRDGARFGRRDIGQAVHAGAALGQARAIYTLHALTNTGCMRPCRRGRYGCIAASGRGIDHKIDALASSPEWLRLRSTSAPSQIQSSQQRVGPTKAPKKGMSYSTSPVLYLTVVLTQRLKKESQPSFQSGLSAGLRG